MLAMIHVIFTHAHALHKAPAPGVKYVSGLKVTNTNTCQSLVQTNLCCVRGKSRLAACMIEMCHASRKESTSEVLELPRHFFEMGVTGTPRIWEVLPLSEFSEP